MQKGQKISVVCIGAGPAGLTAAYILGKNNVKVTVLEKNPVYVGGISRTEIYKGFAFDIGGHRFFSKSQEIETLWKELLGEALLLRSRKSRILYKRKFFDYPLRAGNALRQLGIIETLRCIISYIHVRLYPNRNPKNFQDWVTNHFGKRLYTIFFRSYTEKVWGVPCTQISADWAAQRIKGLSLSKAIWNALWFKKQKQNSKNVIKTLIGSFHYPRRGPGMLWEKTKDHIKQQGNEVLLGMNVVEINLLKNKTWQIITEDPTQKRHEFFADHVISSMPIRELGEILKPTLPKVAKIAAASLQYRDFLTVALITKGKSLFDDNWIYIHDPSVQVGRIQNFKSWSPEMVPDLAYNCYGLEYFCFETDKIWSMPDDELIHMAINEMTQIGLIVPSDVVDGVVIRQPKAYPVYDDHYDTNVKTLRNVLENDYAGLHLVGRNGMHKYNNQDHAMMTAILTVKNILAGYQKYDVWTVNEDAEYHEEDKITSSKDI